MNEMKKINDIIENCASASEITHGISNIGNGSMKLGLQNISNHSKNAGVKKGTIIGIPIGAAVVYIGMQVTKWFKKHNNDGNKIVKGFEDAINEKNVSESEQNCEDLVDSTMVEGMQ